MMEKNGKNDLAFEMASEEEKTQMLMDLYKELREKDPEKFMIAYIGLRELVETGSQEKAIKKMAWFTGMSTKAFIRWLEDGAEPLEDLETWEPSKTLPSGEIYTLKEVAEILKVTYRTALTYVESGSLRARKIGGKWRVKDADLEDFVTAKN